MPVISDYVNRHRLRIPAYMNVSNAMVVRTVKRKEMLSTPAAMKAMDNEWDKMSKQMVWDFITVREKDDVAAKARYTITSKFTSVIFSEYVVSKGVNSGRTIPHRSGKADLYSAEVTSKMYNDTAVFNELSSSPATLEASKAVDAYGSIDGHTSSQCHADQTYMYVRTIPPCMEAQTWVRIPKGRWPSEWTGKFRKPVVLLKLALRGHPDAGGYWESHCKDRLVAGGFTPVSDRNSMFWHSKLKSLLTAYVDDFKMSGPCGNMNKAWKLIRTTIKTAEPSPPGKCPGCNHIIN